jgi:hypothetical protein
MAKRKFNLTEVERKELLKAYQASKDAGTRIRYQLFVYMAKATQRRKLNGSQAVVERV